MGTQQSEQPWSLSGTETSRRVREGILSAGDVVESQIARIEQINPLVNAIVATASDDARETARRIDTAGPFGDNCGMTLTTKVNTDHLGYANDNGIRSMAGNMSPRTAACVEGLLESGMMMIGRTNTPALSMRFHTDNALHGETLNPHGKHISCGGSSGGAAAAVAAGLCHVAQGNDVGGSVRWPAYCNGVIGLRPTIGRMVTGGTNPSPRGWSAANMATNGPIARTMEDLKAAFVAMNKPNWADPFWAPVPLEFPKPAGPIKVALVTTDSFGIHPAVVDVIRKAGSIFSASGYEVEEVVPPMLDEMFTLWTSVGAIDIHHGLRPMLPAIDDKGLSQVYNDWAPAFPEGTGENFMRAHMLRDIVIRAWNAFFNEYPLIVMPGFEVPFMRRGQDTEEPGSMIELARLARYMLNIPALAIPAMSFPMGIHDGAPIGVQIGAHAWREDLIIDAGFALEAHRGPVGPVDPTW